MDQTAEETRALKEYLLGQLTPERGAPLEERLLTDRAFYEELSAAEDELIDLYLEGDLDAADRAAFESHFLSAPERQRKINFARALRRYVATEAAAPAEAVEDAADPQAEAPPEAPPPELGPTPLRRNRFPMLFARRPALAFSLAAALLVSVAAVSWLAVGRRTSQSPRNVYAVTLTTGLTRDSGETRRVTPPDGADTLRLRLELPADADYASYRFELQTPEGRTVHTGDHLKPAETDGRPAVEADVPTELLPAGDYQLKLSGLSTGGDAEPVGRYPFRITAR